MAILVKQPIFALQKSRGKLTSKSNKPAALEAPTDKPRWIRKIRRVKNRDVKSVSN